MGKRDKKIIISIFSIVAIIALIAGSVYAYFSFVTNSGGVNSSNGKLDIYYDIDEPNLTGVLIPSASRSGGVLEVATAKLNAGSIDAAINFYITPTSISGFPLSALCYDVDVLDTSNEVIDTYTGTFESASLNVPLKMIDEYNLTTDLLTFNIYIWLDGSKINNDNFNSNNSFSAMITADSVQITGEFDPLPNPITDYEYEIGTGDAEGYVILKKYIGTSPTVIIPNTYKIDGDVYDVLLYSRTFSDWTIEATFYNNTVITTVSFIDSYNILLYNHDGSSAISNNNMYKLFSGCTSLANVSDIPNSVTDMSYTFSNCTSLVNAPTIPNSVTNMESTFSGCTSLVNAPVIPNSVTNMESTFSGCTSLVNAPEIPSNVTDMGQTFYNCTSLIHASDIPSLVTDVSRAYGNCTSLTGTVRINSSNISFSPGMIEGHPFKGTSEPITVEVPAGSTTYTRLSGYNISNVTLTTFTP